MSLLDAFLLDASKLDVWIAFRTDGVKGSGTESDPYDGSTATGFDDLMASMPSNTTIHLGPGTFETKGFGGDGGWQPKSGQKILGSGIDGTILKSGWRLDRNAPLLGHRGAQRVSGRL